jgi:hypothetical protein
MMLFKGFLTELDIILPIQTYNLLLFSSVLVCNYLPANIMNISKDGIKIEEQTLYS